MLYFLHLNQMRDITKAVNIYKEKYDVYCGRGKGIKNDPYKCKPLEHGWLGNPIALDKRCFICQDIHKENGETLPCYKKYLNERLKEDEFCKEFIKLKGKILGCFCKPKECHLDVICQLLNDYDD